MPRAKNSEVREGAGMTAANGDSYRGPVKVFAFLKRKEVAP